MTTTTTTTDGFGVRWRAAVRSMPAVAALVFGALLVLSTLVMALAVAAGVVGELAERLAVASWATARTIHTAHPPAPAEPDPPPGRPGARAEDPDWNGTESALYWSAR